MTIQVVVADDQTLVRSGLAMILASQPDIEVVAEAQDGASALELARQLRPDIVLMDIRMPGVDGLSATSNHRQRPTARRHQSGDAHHLRPRRVPLRGLQAGAAGFLLKGVAPEDLVRGIREVADGEGLLAPSATRRLITEFVNAGRTTLQTNQPGAASSQLTPKEREVLALMARGLSNAEIAEELIVGANTIKTHIGHVLDKLAARDRVQAVILAYQAGVAVPRLRP